MFVKTKMGFLLFLGSVQLSTDHSNAKLTGLICHLHQPTDRLWTVTDRLDWVVPREPVLGPPYFSLFLYKLRSNSSFFFVSSLKILSNLQTLNESKKVAIFLLRWCFTSSQSSAYPFRPNSSANGVSFVFQVRLLWFELSQKRGGVCNCSDWRRKDPTANPV